ncbi:MAG: glycosyltransferase [Bryobacterales bacterium]|nr:glycosyltransferase [Bryobacterales bacterium]
MSFTATVLITTKDRKDELKQAIESALVQRDLSEILVFDDGSSDGTGELVRREFPSVRLERSNNALGIIAARNHAMQLATGSVVITIDDDCVFQSPNTVRDTLKDFAQSQVGAVAMPHINVTRSPTVYSSPPRRDRIFAISEFTGCASAVRRDLFLALGGFNTVLWRQCEEYDFCTRLLNNGYFTRCGSAAPIAHYESSNRNEDSVVFHSARGHLLYAWCNVPLWALVPHATASAVKCLRHACKTRHLKSAVAGLASAISTIVSMRAIRRPVRSPVYRLMRRLRRRGPLDLSCVASLLRTYEPSGVAV